MKAFLIARVSTADQVDALPAQVYKLTDYAKSRDFEYELFKFQESAYKGTREKFRVVVDQIVASPELLVVVFDKVDRLTRDSGAEEANILRKLCDAGKIELHFPSDGLFLDKDSPSTDKMRLGLNTIFAQYYSDAISDNVKRRNQQLWRDGVWTSPAPFGYKNVTRRDESKWVDIVPLQAAAVLDAYERYATGSYSLKTLRKKIIDEHGFTLTAAQWDRILKNPFYTGIMRIKEQLYPHHYDTVVSEQLFEQAKRIREGYKVVPKRWGGLPYPFTVVSSAARSVVAASLSRKRNRSMSTGTAPSTMASMALHMCLKMI